MPNGPREPPLRSGGSGPRYLAPPTGYAHRLL